MNLKNSNDIARMLCARMEEVSKGENLAGADTLCRGTKTTEYRLYGPRWNERTCVVGRPVVLAKGYGHPRLKGTIASFHSVPVALLPHQQNALRTCYGSLLPLDTHVACIEIEVEV